MKRLLACSRCKLIRYEDRMRPVTSEAHPGQTFWVCTARSSCDRRRKQRTE